MSQEDNEEITVESEVAASSLWDKIGGDATVDVIIETVLTKVSEHELTISLITSLDESEVGLKTKDWFAKVLGGPIADPDSEDLFAALAMFGVTVTEEQMTAFLGYITGVATDLEIPEEFLLELEEALVSASAEILAGGGAVTEAVEGDEDVTITTGSDINISSFDELHQPSEIIGATRRAWKAYLATCSSREAAAEAIYSAIYDAIPSLQSAFVIPRAVQSMRFMGSVEQCINLLDKPKDLKMNLEMMAFQHMQRHVTVEYIVLFRDAILDLFSVELGANLEQEAGVGFTAMLNYIGGSYVWLKANYTVRLNLLAESWHKVSGKHSLENGHSAAETAQIQAEAATSASTATGFWGRFKAASKTAASSEAATEEDGKRIDNRANNNGSMDMQKVPTTFQEMFVFNATVMGFGNQPWMGEVLAVFPNLIENVHEATRVDEECNVLVLRIAKVARANEVNFAEFKSCMLGSLRSLMPKDWDTNHEVAWAWFWENVEMMLATNMGKPPDWERAMVKFTDSLDESLKYECRESIYQTFFENCPRGQDYFKQSTTYLHWISDKVFVILLDIYRDPIRLVDEISAVGLRHVGYQIPTDLFSPFITSFLEVLTSAVPDRLTVDSFRYSLGLVSKMTVRTIHEGSTVIMKAVNQNTQRSMRRAAAQAPRGERARWMLNIQVGTQSISPLWWSIESGQLESTHAILLDLTAIRADRDRYYYGLDDLMNRHHDVLRNLCENAALLLPVFLDGLIWRSRFALAGQRRCNFYIKHFIVDHEGKFALALEWILKRMDPQIVCHQVFVLVSDILWTGVAYSTFLKRKLWLMLQLLAFVTSLAILPFAVIKIASDDPKDEDIVNRAIIFFCRIFIYIFSMVVQIYSHVVKIAGAYRKKETVKVTARIGFPRYLLESAQSLCSLLLAVVLIGMFTLEPLLYCWGYQDQLFANKCPDAEDLGSVYGVLALCATLLYFSQLSDILVCSTKVSAYYLVCTRMIAEMGLFLLALFLVLLCVSSALTCLEHEFKDFSNIPGGFMILFKMALAIYAFESYQQKESNGVVFLVLCVFLFIVVVFLINMLIAQFNCAYDSIYHDMVGYARLKRIKIIVETLPQVSKDRWGRFVTSLHFDTKLEFNDGDVGLAGGVQITEPANAHPISEERIERFGGSTSVSMPFPDTSSDEEGDRFERMENIVVRMLAKLSGATGDAQVTSSGGSAGEGSAHASRGLSAGDE